MKSVMAQHIGNLEEINRDIRNTLAVAAIGATAVLLLVIYSTSV